MRVPVHADHVSVLQSFTMRRPRSLYGYTNSTRSVLLSTEPPDQFWKMRNPEKVVYMYPCRKEARLSSISHTWSPGSRLRMATLDDEPQKGMLSAHTVATMIPFFSSITPACKCDAAEALLG